MFGILEANQKFFLLSFSIVLNKIDKLKLRPSSQSCKILAKNENLSFVYLKEHSILSKIKIVSIPNFRQVICSLFI